MMVKRKIKWKQIDIYQFLDVVKPKVPNVDTPPPPAIDKPAPLAVDKPTPPTIDKPPSTEVDKSTTFTVHWCKTCGFVAKTKADLNSNHHDKDGHPCPRNNWSQWEVPKDEFGKFPRRVNLSGPEPLIKKVERNGKL